MSVFSYCQADVWLCYLSHLLHCKAEKLFKTAKISIRGGILDNITIYITGWTVASSLWSLTYADEERIADCSTPLQINHQRLLALKSWLWIVCSPFPDVKEANQYVQSICCLKYQPTSHRRPKITYELGDCTTTTISCFFVICLCFILLALMCPQAGSWPQTEATDWTYPARIIQLHTSQWLKKHHHGCSVVSSQAEAKASHAFLSNGADKCGKILWRAKCKCTKAQEPAERGATFQSEQTGTDDSFQLRKCSHHHLAKSDNKVR